MTAATHLTTTQIREALAAAGHAPEAFDFWMAGKAAEALSAAQTPITESLQAAIWGAAQLIGPKAISAYSGRPAAEPRIAAFLAACHEEAAIASIVPKLACREAGLFAQLLRGLGEQTLATAVDRRHQLSAVDGDAHYLEPMMRPREVLVELGERPDMIYQDGDPYCFGLGHFELKFLEGPERVFAVTEKYGEDGETVVSWTWEALRHTSNRGWIAEISGSCDLEAHQQIADAATRWANSGGIRA